MKRFLVISIMLLVSFLFVNFVLAGTPRGNLDDFATKDNVGAGYKTGTTPAVYVGNILSAVYGLLGIVTMIFVVYGGFMWMFAQGNDQKIQEAKKIITSAIIGLAILLSAYLITAFAVSALA